MSAGAFDLLLAGSLVGLVFFLLLVGADLFRSIVLFIVFGLMMALAWARLNAPDLALAEAIVGAGITGALLIVAWHRMERGWQAKRSAPSVMLVFPAVCVVAGILIQALVMLGEGNSGLKTEVMARLPESGVRSPVTAVLLNFRGYDTLLEIGVLLLAVAAVRLVGTTQHGAGAVSKPVLSAFAAMVIPLLVVVSGYLLWRGGHAPGGAFQAGAMLGAAGIMLWLVSPSYIDWWHGARVNTGLVIAPSLFLLIALFTLFSGTLLEYPRSWASGLILLIEAVATFSIAAALIALFLGIAESQNREQKER